MASEVTLRPMTAADIPAAQALTTSFGWPHRREDWALMEALGQGIVAERDGRLVGMAVAWRYGADWASLGGIGVAAELQGQGIGRRLLRALMEELGDRNLVLHATKAGMRLYADEGFAPSWSIVQHQGVAGRADAQVAPGIRLRPAGPADGPVITALDRAACGMERPRLITKLLEEPGGVVLDEDGTATGFALLRHFGRGRVIGPVAAPDVERAKAMIAQLIERHVGAFLRIDIPTESGLVPWLTAAGLRDAGTVIRMVRGNDRAADQRIKTFALASQALG